ncbi:MAG TPA: hypothetical protein VEB42_10850, partial [Chitinophagaceae bacterium]|nr:hypothetical protein [Chitinophagaceae bacterium]
MMRRIFALIMAVLITWSSAGAAVYQHICRAGGLYEASFTQITPCKGEVIEMQVKACCSDLPSSDETALSNSKCCDYTTTFNKIDTESTQVNHAQSILKVAASLLYLPVMVLSSIFTVAPAILENILSRGAFTHIISIGDRDIHALLQTFRC